MNKIYKVVKNATGMSVASELAKGCGKTKSVLASALLSAFANIAVAADLDINQPTITDVPAIADNININSSLESKTDVVMDLQTTNEQGAINISTAGTLANLYDFSPMLLKAGTINNEGNIISTMRIAFYSPTTKGFDNFVLNNKATGSILTNEDLHFDSAKVTINNDGKMQRFVDAGFGFSFIFADGQTDMTINNNGFIGAEGDPIQVGNATTAAASNYDGLLEVASTAKATINNNGEMLGHFGGNKAGGIINMINAGIMNIRGADATNGNGNNPDDPWTPLKETFSFFNGGKWENLANGEIHFISSKDQFKGVEYNATNAADSVAYTWAANHFGSGAMSNKEDAAFVAQYTFDFMDANGAKGSFVHGGTVDLSSKAAGVGDIFKIIGDYEANGGTLVLDTVMQNTDDKGNLSNHSDMLIVDGDVRVGAGGATTIMITPRDFTQYGFTSKELNQQDVHKIKVVQVTGASDANAFTKGNVITLGAYEYDFRQEGTDWYLSNTTFTQLPPPPAPPAVQPQMLMNPYISNYQVNQHAGMVMFHQSFMDRRIGQSMAYTAGSSLDGTATSGSAAGAILDSWHGRTFWANTQYNAMRSDAFNGQHEMRAKTQQVQIGMDILQNANFNAGLFTGYGISDTKVKSKATGSKTEGKVKGYMIGAYATYMPESTGFYLDTWGYYSAFKNELNDKIANMKKAKYDSSGFALSAEAGYAMPLAQIENGAVMIKPHAQVIYSYLDSDSFSDGNTLYKGKDTSGVQTKLGARLYHQAKDGGVAPFIEANWIHNAMDSLADVNGQEFKHEIGKNVGEAKIGLSGKVNDNINVWGNVSGRAGSDSYRDYGVQLGVGIRW